MIRPAQPDDAKQVIPLFMQILKDMEIPEVQTIGFSKTQALLEAAFKEPDYRYGFCQIAVFEQPQTTKILGACAGYPAAKEAQIDEPLQAHLGNFDLPHDFSFFHDVEAKAGEWYLDSLAVAPEFQRHGIGGQLLDYLSVQLAKQKEQMISLNVDLANTKAERLYRHHGYVKQSELMIGSHRYAHLVRPLQSQQAVGL